MNLKHPGTSLSGFHGGQAESEKKNTLPSGGLYATYHLLGEPETTIDPGPWS